MFLYDSILNIDHITLYGKINKKKSILPNSFLCNIFRQFIKLGQFKKVLVLTLFSLCFDHFVVITNSAIHCSNCSTEMYPVLHFLLISSSFCSFQIKRLISEQLCRLLLAASNHLHLQCATSRRCCSRGATRWLGWGLYRPAAVWVTGLTASGCVSSAYWTQVATPQLQSRWSETSVISKSFYSKQQIRCLLSAA